MLLVCVVWVASQCMAWLNCVLSPRTRDTRLSGRVRSVISHKSGAHGAIEVRLGALGVCFEPMGSSEATRCKTWG